MRAVVLSLALLGLCAAPASADLQDALESVVVVETAFGQGSGFALGAPGVIYTNAHVVGGAQTVELLLADKRRVEAEVVDADEAVDVAVLRTSIALPALRRGPEPRVGADIFALGAPDGLTGTATKGIVSARDRVVRGQPRLQMDLDINPGSSGGPVLDTRDRVVGIAVSKRVDVDGVNFAIPIDRALAAVGRPSRAAAATQAPPQAADPTAPATGAGAWLTIVAAITGVAAVSAAGVALLRRPAGAPEAPLVVRRSPASASAEPIVVVRRGPGVTPTPPTTPQEGSWT